VAAVVVVMLDPMEELAAMVVRVLSSSVILVVSVALVVL
jgi:hypothetical protein